MIQKERRKRTRVKNDFSFVFARRTIAVNHQTLFFLLTRRTKNFSKIIKTHNRMSAMRAKTEKQGSKTASRVSSAVKPNLRALNDQNYNNGDNTGTFVFNTAAKERSKIVALSKSLYEAEDGENY